MSKLQVVYTSLTVAYTHIRVYILKVHVIINGLWKSSFEIDTIGLFFFDAKSSTIIILHQTASLTLENENDPPQNHTSDVIFNLWINIYDVIYVQLFINSCTTSCAIFFSTDFWKKKKKTILKSILIYGTLFFQKYFPRWYYIHTCKKIEFNAQVFCKSLARNFIYFNRVT